MTRPGANPVTITLLVAGLAALAPFALDTYLPAFPEIAASLGTRRAAVQQSLTAYLAPYAAMMLVHGPLSDRHGRRASIIGALLVFCVASLGCAAAQSIEAFLVCRALQGISVGATTVVGRALIRDLFEGPAAQRRFAQVNAVFTLAPVAAPFVGGYLLVALGWRSSYALTLLLVCGRWLPETLPPSARTPLRLGSIPGNMAALVSHGPFGALALMAAASFCGFFVYVLAAPAFVRDLLMLEPEQFGWLFVATATGTLLGSWWASRRADTHSPCATIGLGLALSAAAAAANLGWHATLAPAFPASLLPLTLYCCGNALLMPSATLLILDTSPLPRGATSSLQSFTQIACATLTSAAVVPMAARSAAGLALAMLAWWSVAALCWIGYRRARPTSPR
jgi:DHA1 family bicyclomycin/chloramphenicol resistance-like MFS transporter